MSSSDISFEKEDKYNIKRNKIIGILTGICMNVNNVIGSGIFTTPGMVWKALNSPQLAMILWTVGGIISLAGSLTYAEVRIFILISLIISK